MFRFISVTILLFAATATGITQEAKQKESAPIIPEGEKMFVGEAVVKSVKLDWKNCLVQTPRGTRLTFTLNGQAYLVTELKYKAERTLVTITIANGQLNFRIVER